MGSVKGPDSGQVIEALRLLRSRRVGAVTWHRLVDEHGTAAAALSALPALAGPSPTNLPKRQWQLTVQSVMISRK